MRRLLIKLSTYHAVGKDDADFQESAGELVLRDASFVLDVEELKCLLQEGALVLSGWALLRQLSLQVFLETAPSKTVSLVSETFM